MLKEKTKNENEKIKLEKKIEEQLKYNKGVEENNSKEIKEKNKLIQKIE